MVKPYSTSVFIVILTWLSLAFSHQVNANDPSPEIPLFKDYLGKVYVSVQPTKITQGEKVTLTIKGENLASSFEKIDWSQFNKHFVIYDVDSGFDRIKIKLYPITHGIFNLSAQKAGLIKLPNISIEVLPNPDVSIDWHRPELNLYAQQNTLWKATVWVKNSANKITFEQRHSTLNQEIITHFQTLPVHNKPHTLLTSGQSQPDQSKGKTQTFVASYEVKPWSNTQSKELRLHSPAVVIKNPSNQRWYFFDKPIITLAQPLPSFLPMTVAVGQVEWEMVPMSVWQETGALNHWTWQIKGTGLTEAYMNNLAHQLMNQIKHNPAIEWLSDSRDLTTDYTTQGLQTTLQLRLPYRINQMGFVDFPDLKLDFFNPLTGKLESIIQPSHTKLAIPTWVIWLGLWLLLLAGIFVLFFAGLSLKQAWLNRRLRKAIRLAKNVNELWQSMLNWRQDQLSWQDSSLKRFYGELPLNSSRQQEGLPQSHVMPSLGQWQDWYNQQYGKNSEFNQLICLLNKTFYSAQLSQKSQQEDWLKLQKIAHNWSLSLPCWNPRWLPKIRRKNS